jgi:hypothetical protein
MIVIDGIMVVTLLNLPGIVNVKSSTKTLSQLEYHLDDSV